MNATDLINYLNYFFLGVIALSALLGFWFGAFRSIYFFAGFLALFVIGWFLSPVLARVLFTVDMSALGTINDIEITTIEGVIPSLLEKISPEMGEIFAPGSGIYDFGVAAVLMTLRLVTFSVWLIVVIPILTFVLWIVYLFIKPKRKKTLVSRFIGVGVTVLHSLLSLFILSIFLAGLTSAAHSAISLTETAPSEDEPAQIIFTDQGPMLRLDNAEFEEFDFIFEFAGNYRESYLGKMSGLIKIDKAGLDEYMFDELFSLKYRKTKIKLRKELATVIRLYDLIAENVEGEINLESLVALPEEVKEQIVEEVKRLKILRVAIPLGIEYVVASGVLEKELGDLEEYLDIEKVIPELLEIDYEKEIGYLAAAFLDALALELHKMGENSQLLLTLDADTVDSLLDNVGSLQIIDIVGNEMLAAFVVSEAAQNFYEKIGFTEEIDLEGVEIGSEIRNLGNIYRAFASFGITTTDYKEIDFSQITDGHINELGEAIFGSTLFSKNGGLLACALVNQLPEEYRTVITVNQFELNDFTSIAGLGLVLFSVGFFEEGADPQPADLLTEDNIEKIADYISCSGLLSANVGGILNVLMQAVELPEGLEIAIDSEFNWSGESGRAEIVALFTAANKLLELGIGESEDFLSSLTEAKIEELSDALAESQIFMSNIENILNYFLTDPEITGGMEFTIREMDWPSPTGKAEFKALLHAVATIYETDLLDNPEPTEFTNEQIDKLASALSASIIIRDNLSNIIVQAVGESVDFEIAVFDNPDDWTETEIGSLLRAARIISGKENYLVFTEEEADVLLASNLIVDSIVLLLEKYTEPEGELYDLLIIDGITDWRDTYEGEVRVDGELRRFFNASRILLGDNPDINDPDSLIDLNRLLNLSDGSVDPEDDEWGKLLASVILKQSLVNQLIKYGTDKVDEHGNVTEESVIVVKLETGDSRWDGELRAFFRAVKTILGDSDLNDFNFDPNILKDLTTGAPGEETDEVGEILSSIIVTDTIIRQIIKLGDDDSELVVALDEDDPRWYDSDTEDGEIRKLIVAVKIVFNKPEDDLNNPSLDPNIVFELSDGRADPADDDLGAVLSSQIISDTIIKKLIELGEDEVDGEGNVINEAVLVVDLETDDARWRDGEEGLGEIKRLVFGAKVLLGENPNLNNPAIIDEKDLLRLEEEEIDILLDSIILSKTMVKEIKKVDSLVIPEELEGPENEHLWYDEGISEGELRKLIRVAKLMLTEDSTEVDADKILNLADDDVDVILESLVMKATIKNELYNVENLVIDEEHPDFYWDDCYVNGDRVDGELRKLLKAAPLLIENEQANVDKLLDLGDGSADVNGDGIVDEKDDQIAILTASRIIVDTAVKELKTMTAAGGELYEVLYLPVDDEVEYHGPDGEMRRFIIAIKHVAAANTEPGQGISDIDQISIASLTDADTRDDIVASKIIATTIIVNIEIEAAKEGSAIALAPELDRNNPDSYDPAAWDAELPKFLDAIAVFTGDSDINDISFGAEEFLNISDEDIDKVVDSRVISYSIIKKLEDEHNSPDSLITIPDQYGPAPAEATNEALWYEGGELRRTLRALRELGINDYEDKFPLQAVFAEAKGEVPEVILASEIVENTIVKRIETEADGGSLDGVLIYPADWDPADWYGPEGELRKFLAGIEMIVGTEDFESATFEADRFLGDDRDKLLSSRLIEASAVEYIIDSADSEGGALSGALYLPADLETNNVNWYRSGGGELDRFLDAIEIIVGDGGEYGDANFAVDTILGAERDVLLDSRVVEHSAIVYIRSSEKLTIPDKSEDRYYYLTGDLVWVRTYDENGDLVDEGELRRFLSGIDYILGDDADFETFVFEMDNFLAIEDFTVILASRVLEATLADMTEEVLASEALIDFIKEPDDGYQWFHHAASEETGITGVVRRGEYALTETTYQYSDLAGFLDAVRQMDAVNLNYDSIDAYAIASSASDDSEKLAEALWDYSRVMRGSIATMLNEAIDRISVPPIFEPFKPVFTDDDFQNKDDVQEKLDQFAAFIDMIS